MVDTCFLICNRLDRPPPVPAVQRTCVDCGAAIWVSMSMQPKVDAGEVLPKCMPCAPWEPEHGTKLTVLPEQVKELSDAGLLRVAGLVLATHERLSRPHRSS